LELVGRYRVRERIGEGATADVFRAYDPEIGRDLAIKVLKPEYREKADYAQRFLREAKAAGALSHPNIVTVYDVGEVDGHACIVTELLDGEPLDRLLRRGEQLAPETAMTMGIQLAEGLAYAHALGVVHRDIKPSNIFVSADRRSVKILDFGIARVSELDQTTFQSDAPMTQIGQVLGTPRYMSPEQTLGQTIDGRSDLFSVGVVLYELISGCKAFDGASAVSVALQITQREPPPLAQIAPQAPAGLVAIVNRLLAKDPQRRFNDGAQLAAALRREHKQYLAMAESDRGRRGLPLHVRMTLLMATIVGVVLALSISTVLQRQYAAMKHMALTSGVAITSFVASNVALCAAENATLPPDRRDWLPVQAFTKVAAADGNVRKITVMDADGVARASSDPSVVGHAYAALPPGNETLGVGGVRVAAAHDAGGKRGFRFVRPVIYNGRAVGAVEVVLSAGDLDATAGVSTTLLIALGLVTLLAVVVVAWMTTRALTRSLRSLNTALCDAVEGDLEVRILHHRTDELGQAFDGFNRLLATLASRASGAADPADQPASAPFLSGPAALSIPDAAKAESTANRPGLPDPDQTVVAQLPAVGVQQQSEAMSRLWDLLRKRRVA
jgi:serine/threonine-protein kinase